MRSFIRSTALVLSACPMLAAQPAGAVPSTARGQISVSQVIQMVEGASSDGIARQLLTAYLGGVGETAGRFVSLRPGSCEKPLSLDAGRVRQLLASDVDAGRQAETAATPIILRDMLNRAGCRER